MSVPARGRVLLSVTGFNPHRWYELLSKEREVVLEPEPLDDPSIEYAVLWKQKRGILSKLPNLKVIFSIGAGVDHILADDLLPDVPIVRVVADNLSEHMREYIAWRVLDHHRQGMLYRSQQRQKIWHDARQVLAREVTVGIMGFGHLGRQAAEMLMPFGFKINGWSRRPREMAGVSCYSGEEGLTPFLNATDILVVLLPLTPQTDGIVNRSLLSKLRKDGPLGGPCLINAGRGRLQRDDEILRALEEGILKEASLDVFEHEPLARTSPLWNHPRVFITPHAAATSYAEHLAAPMLAQMDAFEHGEPLRNVVDRETGY